MSGFCKYNRYRKYASYNGGYTWNGLNEYALGEIIETDSPECGSMDPPDNSFDVCELIGLKICGSLYLTSSVLSAYFNLGFKFESNMEITVNGLFQMSSGFIIGENDDGTGNNLSVYYSNNYFHFAYGKEDIRVTDSSINGMMDDRVSFGDYNLTVYGGTVTHPATTASRATQNLTRYKNLFTSKDIVYLNNIKVIDKDTKEVLYNFVPCEYKLKNETIKAGLFEEVNMKIYPPLGDTSVIEAKGGMAVDLYKFGCDNYDDLGTSYKYILTRNLSTDFDEIERPCDDNTSITASNTKSYSADTVFAKIGNCVEDIGDETFKNFPDLISVDIGSNVRTIGAEAFRKCDNLTRVTLRGKNVVSIGDNAFYESRNMNINVENLNNVKSFGEYSFYDCQKMTGDLVISDYVRTIPTRTFFNCTGLTSVVIGKNVETIGEGAFFECNGLTGELVIPDSVTSIGEFAFIYCHNLSKLTLSENIKRTGSSAFTSCYGLTGELVIPDSVTSIDNGSFLNCTGLTSVVIGKNVETIGNSAFRGCRSLSGELVIPDSVTSIGESGFTLCDKLTTVVIGKNVETIQDYAFYNCSGLTSVTILADKVPNLANYRAFRATLTTINYPIYVPNNLLNDYKNASNWRSLSDRIMPIT